MKPWREVARPHKDVLEGTFQQSDFAADISRVANGTATPDAVRACFRRASRGRRPRMRPLQHPARFLCDDDSDTSGEEDWVIHNIWEGWNRHGVTKNCREQRNYRSH